MVGDAVAAGSSINDASDIIDMADYDSVMFVTTITDSAATGVAEILIEQNDANSGSGMAAITGSTATVTSEQNDDLNGKTLITEVFRPSKRYVRATRKSATANIAYGECIAILVPRRRPADTHASVADSAYVAN